MTRKMEIFWGTGGVGKTTLAASRAVHLSRQKKKVLLVTIDPSKRLRQVFDIEDDSVGKNVDVGSFELLVFTPEETFKRILDGDVRKGLDSRILNILMRPYGGMNEIMAILEIQYQLKSGKYDVIVLDTAPGKHFVDFARGAQKINNFFEKKFIEVIKYYTGHVDSDRKGIFDIVVKAGMDKIFKYMKMVAGEQFVEEFTQMVWGLYNNKDVFMSALDFEKKLQEKEFAHWFLVTSTGKEKLKEVALLHDELKEDLHYDEHLLINKSAKRYLEEWKVDERDPLCEVKRFMQEGELGMIQLAKASFDKVLVFPEILSRHPQEHVEALSGHWELHEL